MVQVHMNLVERISEVAHSWFIDVFNHVLVFNEVLSNYCQHLMEIYGAVFVSTIK